MPESRARVRWDRRKRGDGEDGEGYMSSGYRISRQVRSVSSQMELIKVANFSVVW